MSVLHPKASGSGRTRVTLPLAEFSNSLLHILKSCALVQEVDTLGIHRMLGMGLPHPAGADSDQVRWVLAPINFGTRMNR